MGLIGRVARALALVAWGVYTCAISIPHSFFRERWTAVREMCEVIKLWGRGLLRIFNIKVEIHGKTVSGQGSFIISNHLGVLDIIVYASVFGLRFAPKADVRSWPLLGRYIDLSHPIWVDRASKSKSQESLEEFRQTLLHGIPMVIFPEGTSTNGKSGVLPFKPMLFEAALKDNLPLQPVLILYRVPEGSSVDPCWYGDMTLLPHLWDLLSAPGIVAELHILPEILPNGRDRKDLAADIHALLQEEYNRVSSLAQRPFARDTAIDRSKAQDVELGADAL